MELGFVGLGRMGMNMVRRLQRDAHRVVTFDRSAETVQGSVREGAIGAASLKDMVATLTPPRAVWIMVPAGEPTEGTVRELAALLEPDDVIIDGGNSYYKDDARRAEQLGPSRIHYVDAGTSGGIWGLQVGYCLMVGGEEAIFKRLEPIFKTLAPERGYAYMGPSGAGHYVKMIHNGIEYGMMQAYAEGFELLSKSSFELKLPRIADLWMQGSVVRSWLLELAASALSADPRLEKIKGYVEDSGEGRWTVLDAVEKDVPALVLTASLYTRFRSRQEDSFADKMLAALRNAFGGHAVRSGRP
ncbi:MAG: decarboxylating 6-phosphogluconate dehydrogenase [Candidatus Rokubacteria bacterium]|nr:decarboxylating 6-phosphogluconate dehydrogenase [Candidatus Rokubacteria bacterium]MBI3826194.1 decarboxylating 6-phosphogluconate dehydrogenase [Candidatus Rokubacteria bacterium]